MTVYVDQYPEWLGVPRKWTGGGHLIGTDLAELHLFANSIGLKFEWFQDKGWPHYDLTASKRTKALHFGAVPIQAGEAPKEVIRHMPKPQPKIEIDHDALEQVRTENLKWRHQPEQLRGAFSSRYVEGEGDNPRVMLIGEAPGAQEDLKRRPFVGDSGLVLRELMAIAGLFTGGTPHFGEANCWLTNVIKFRPPRNRTPTMAEIMSVRHLIRGEWKAVGQPRIIVAIGGVSLTAIYGRKLSMLKLSGTLRYEHSRDGMEMAIFPMLHPSYGLRGGKKVQEVLEGEWGRLGEFLKGIDVWSDK